MRTKLLSGFLGILILAGFACLIGMNGINHINYQNRIGVIVDKILDDAHAAQAAALRYIIYLDEDYYDLSLYLLKSVMIEAETAGEMMTDAGNRDKITDFQLKVEDYRALIGDFRNIEIKRVKAEAERIEEGLELVDLYDAVKRLYEDISLDEDASPAERRAAQHNEVIVQSALDRINSLRTLALRYLLQQSDYERSEVAQEWTAEIEMIGKEMLELETVSPAEQSGAIVRQAADRMSQYLDHVKVYHVSTMAQWALQYEQRESAAIMILHGDKVRDGVQETNDDVTMSVMTVMSVTLGLAVIFSIMIALILSRNITNPLIRGTRVAGNIADGRLDTAELDLSRNDELGELALALDKMAASLKVQHWLFKGRHDLDDELRGDRKLDELAEAFIKFITVHLESQLGAFYLFDGEDSLNLTASYAFSQEEETFNKIKIGEGLVGQAAKERRTLYFSHPDNGPVFNSGVAEQIPSNILTAPLVFKKELIGIFLIGAFEPFSADKRLFIDENLSTISVLFNAAKSRETINYLYQRAQTQQAELVDINNELEQQASALRESEAELQAQQEELRVTNEELEERTQAMEQQRDSIRIKNEDLIRAQAEIEKKASDLEQASRYKSEFLANMSHELRTPLNSILILGQLLSGNQEGNLTDKQIKSAAAIHSSGSDLLQLINEILDLSKVEAGKVDIHNETMSLSRFESDLDRIIRPSAEEKGLELTFKLAPQVPDEIITDGHRLQQILRNLLTNAVKFTEEGFVRFEITMPDRNWNRLEPGSYLVLSVHDSGIGISSDKQAAVFEAFQQADGSTIRKYGGTGLGLSISRELAKLLGGEIRLQSAEGDGSTFSLYLPVKPAGSEPSAEKSPAAEPLPLPEPAAVPAEYSEDEPADDRIEFIKGEKSILIIEDDVEFLNILIDLVRERGFKALAARDGETGLHFADYYRPTAVLLDIGLPGIDGWAVMERLKNDSQLRHMPVHVISGNENSLNAMKMGAVGYLTKPVSLEDIDGALSKLDRIASTSPGRLLLVEDDEAQRLSIRELIGEGDVEIIEHSTGKEAFSALLNESLDCMILDLGLKDMSGFELLEKIQSDPDCPRIPIIIYTGRELSREEEDTLKKYTESIIIKGVKSPERLLDETSLFLHRLESELPVEQQNMLRELHDREAVLAGKTILLVDDDMRNVFALTNILEDKELKVIIARDGIEALEKLDLEPGIDLVLMDIMMPRMDGYDAMTEIRKNPNLRKLPVIALTAKAMKGDRNRCIEAGASDYLAKPVDTGKLLSMLRVWLY